MILTRQLCRLAPLLIAFAVAGCGSIFTPEPVGIGRDRDQLKQSPCACNEILQDYHAWHRPG